MYFFYFSLNVALSKNRIFNWERHKAAAAVFTSNRAKANPILWSQQAIVGGAAKAIVLNSGGANCFTGHEGFQTTHATAEAVAVSLTATGLELKTVIDQMREQVQNVE